jgi:hypothetical protein
MLGKSAMPHNSGIPPLKNVYQDRENEDAHRANGVK